MSGYGFTRWGNGVRWIGFIVRVWFTAQSSMVDAYLYYGIQCYRRICMYSRCSLTTARGCTGATSVPVELPAGSDAAVRCDLRSMVGADGVVHSRGRPSRSPSPPVTFTPPLRPPPPPQTRRRWRSRAAPSTRARASLPSWSVWCTPTRRPR